MLKLPLLMTCAYLLLGRISAVWAQPVVATTVANAQTRLTITQGDVATVIDRRIANLPAGRSLLRFKDVAARLDPDTVQPVITGIGTVEILEQHFLNDMNDKNNLLQHYVGQPVTLQRAGEPALKGTLLAADNGILLDTADGLALNPYGTFLLPHLDSAVVTAPTLEWLVNAATAGQYSVESRYATAGLNWQSSYRATLNAAGDRMTLVGWLNVTNESGADYRGAQLTLQTGKMSEGAPVFSLPRAVDLPRHESRQLSYVVLPNVAVRQEIVCFAAQARPDFLTASNAAPQVTLRLRNTKDAGIGVPLPSGPLTVWGLTVDGDLRRLAQRDLPSTDPDQRLWIPLGPAPRITAARSVTASRQLNPVTKEHDLQIALANGRTEPVTVAVVEQLPLGAKITDSSTPPVVIEPGLVEFDVAVPATGAATLKYVVEVKG